MDGHHDRGQPAQLQQEQKLEEAHHLRYRYRQMDRHDAGKDPDSRCAESQHGFQQLVEPLVEG